MRFSDIPLLIIIKNIYINWIIKGTLKEYYCLTFIAILIIRFKGIPHKWGPPSPLMQRYTGVAPSLTVGTITVCIRK